MVRNLFKRKTKNTDNIEETEIKKGPRESEIIDFKDSSSYYNSNKNFNEDRVTDQEYNPADYDSDYQTAYDPETHADYEADYNPDYTAEYPPEYDAENPNETDPEFKYHRRAKYHARTDRFLNNGIIIVGALLICVLLIAFFM